VKNSSAENSHCKEINLKYGEHGVKTFCLPKKNLAFESEAVKIDKLENIRRRMVDALNDSIGSKPLHKLISKDDNILILIDDNTRMTPVAKLLPILLGFLEDKGINMSKIEILVANGTHRLMTDDEIINKVGKDIFTRLKISQHDYEDKNMLVELDPVWVDDKCIPISVNRKAIEADIIIGFGNIVPHCDAGFSGGAKILQPGICGYSTTAATHIAAALLCDIPLGVVDNPCRQGMEKVASQVGLTYIINVVMNLNNEIVDLFCGNFIEAHRKGVLKAKEVYGVIITELYDIVVVSSYPYDLDYWQAEKAVISASFAVKEGGTIIFVAPCFEGLEHNHPKLRNWLRLGYTEACQKAIRTSPENEESDLIAADIAICNSRIREKTHVYLVSNGLDENDCMILGYKKVSNIQDTINMLLANNPKSKVCVLHRGGDCLPIFK
jgi:lactate racemase